MMRAAPLMFALAFLFAPLLLVLPLMLGARGSAAKSSSTNNLKQIALSMHNHNDTFLHLPYNGGHTDPDELKKINFGWHNMNVRDSGTWATQVLPFLEQEPFYRNNVLTGKAAVELPEYLTNAANNGNWQVTIKTLICPGRGRSGHKTNTGKGCFPGPVTDYAINVFLNSAPSKYSEFGFAVNGGLPIDGQQKMTIQGIQDGSSNTIMVGGKALPPAVMANNSANEWDEGIFSPGNYKAANEKSTLTSTGTGRGHVVVAEPPKENQKERPKGGGVPWIWRDTELTAEPKKRPEYALDWGGPFGGGFLTAFGDGSVRTVPYKQRGTVNFARMLYPSDGAVVVFD